jgi:hypothetical protein
MKRTYTIRDGKLVEIDGHGLGDRITVAGDSLRTGPPTEKYLENYDEVFDGGEMARRKRD